MKNIISLALCSMLSFTISFADNYKILYINTPSVIIDNKQMHVGDTFDDSVQIKWDSDKQAIKVLNVQTKKVRLFAAKQFSQTKSIKDFYLKQNHLSSRGGEMMNEEELREYLSGHFYMLDNIEFSTILAVDENAYFSIVIDGRDSSLPEINGNIVIGRELFNVSKGTIKVSVFYNDKVEKQKILITDIMEIEMLPMLKKE